MMVKNICFFVVYDFLFAALPVGVRWRFLHGGVYGFFAGCGDYRQ